MTQTLDGRQRLVLAIAVLASFVAFLDGTIVNVALPAISRELGGGLTTQQWAVDAYLITLGALILLAGSISDAYGRVPVLSAGLIGFAVSSVAVALAPNVAVLIAARALQGAAGAFLVPSSLALITATTRGPAQGRSIGLWTSFTTGAMVVGPLVGGLFVDYVSWRWAFGINVLPIAVTLWLLRRLELSEQPTGTGIDWWGAVTCTAGLGLAVFALIEQPHLGWASPVVLATLIVGLALLGVFWWLQRVGSRPMMPLGLFAIGNFAAGNLATLLIYAGLAVWGFVTAIYLQQGAGLSATLAGLASLPTTVMMVLLSSRAGTWAGRFGPRIFMTLGPAIMAAGTLLLLTVAPAFDYWWQVLPSMVIAGLGLALTVAPLTSAVLGAVDSERSGIASAVNNAVARIAGLVGVAAVAAVAGGSLDLAGFHRTVWVTAALFGIGGLASWLGIRNAAREPDPVG